MQVSTGLHDALDATVDELIQDAVRRAQANDRTTVQPGSSSQLHGYVSEGCAERGLWSVARPVPATHEPSFIVHALELRTGIGFGVVFL